MFLISYGAWSDFPSFLSLVDHMLESYSFRVTDDDDDKAKTNTPSIHERFSVNVRNLTV